MSNKRRTGVGGTADTPPLATKPALPVSSAPVVNVPPPPVVPTAGAPVVPPVATPVVPVPVIAPPAAPVPAALAAEEKPAAPAPIKPAVKKPAPLAKAVTAPPAPVRNEATAAPVVRPAAPAMKDSDMTDTIENVTDKTQTFFADANERAKAAAEKGAKAFEEAGAFHKGNLEAVVESSKIAAKGAENIARYSVDYAKGTVEKVNANARKLAAVKSPTEFFQLQTELAREAFDAVAQESAKFTENYLKLLGEIAQPYQNRFAVAAEKIKAAA